MGMRMHDSSRLAVIVRWVRYRWSELDDSNGLVLEALLQDIVGDGRDGLQRHVRQGEGLAGPRHRPLLGASLLCTPPTAARQQP